MIDLFQGAVFFVSKKEKKKRGDTISIDDSIFVRKGVSTHRALFEATRKREKGSRARARETLSCASSSLSEEEEEEEERTQNKHH